jgi:hypothetical protein
VLIIIHILKLLEWWIFLLSEESEHITIKEEVEKNWNDSPNHKKSIIQTRVVINKL